jgi:hypothetical protein
MATYAEQLANVQTAIEAIETRGQAVSVEGKTLSRADLQTLYDREAYLRRMAARETAGRGIRLRRVIFK